MKQSLQKSFVFGTLIIITLLVLPIAPATSTHAQQPPRCFNETAYCIEPGPILTYWEQNGGLPVFGLPITELRTETLPAPTQDNPNATWTGPVQWFERDRLEDHTAEGTGVLAGLLGSRYLELQGRPWVTFDTVGPNEVGPACTYFEATNHSICEPFLTYWVQRGGLPRFGYPITEPIEETLEVAPGETWTGTVQYFERRRMEFHPNETNPDFRVQLGLLGSAVHSFQPFAGCDQIVLPPLRSAYERISFFRDDMGCPGNIYTNVPASIQNFENGLMIWIELSETDRRIFAYISYGSYFSYNDTWSEGDPDTPEGINPPDGLYKPRRGFGKVWINDPNLRNNIGWAIEERERADTATVQLFEDGAMVWIKGTDNVYVFGPDEWKPAELLPRQ